MSTNPIDPEGVPTGNPDPTPFPPKQKPPQSAAAFAIEPPPPTPYALVPAMARCEGWYARGAEPNRPQRNNNPLDLTYCSESAAFGATGGDPRFAVFPDAATGWRAARRWLLVPARFDAAGNLVGGYCGATLRQIINRFAPPSENDSSQYLEDVATMTSIKPDQIVTADMIDATTGVDYDVLEAR
jgi:hypothetical protein